MTQNKAAPRSLVERAYRELKRRIMGNDYGPNLRVLEQDLARQLGVSRTPVREALIRLANEGLVEAILAGDGPRAHQIHHRHRRRALGLLSEILERDKLSQL